MDKKYFSELRVIDSLRAGNGILFKRFSTLSNHHARFYNPSLASVKRLISLITNKVIEISSIDPETGEIQFKRNKHYKYAPITYLHRDDIRSVDYDPSDLTDADLEGIAECMGRSYVSGEYWADLRYWLDHEEVPELENKDSDNEY